MKSVWIGAIFFANLLSTLPPPVPSAGVVERQLEKEYEAEPLELGQTPPSLKIDIPKERLESLSMECVYIQSIEVYGIESISCQQVQKSIEQFVDRNLCLKEIYEICAAIDEIYAKQGYFLARTYPPPQTIKDGVLILQVMEGCLGEVEIEGEQFYTQKFIRSFFNRLKGKPLCYDQFLRTLLLLNETSDLEAAAVLTKGKKIGTADVIIRIKDQNPRHLYLSANNYGRKLTTNFRAGGRLDAGSLLTFGDKLSIAGVIGFPVEALYFTDVVYRFPVDRNGTFLELSYLFSKFKIKEDPSFHQKGVSDIATIKGVHAVTRSKTWIIDFFSYFDYKQIQNLVFSERTSFDKLRVLTSGFLLDHFSNSTGRDYFNLRMALGIPDFLGGLKSVDSECSRIGAGGLFVKLNADYDRLQTIVNDFYATLHVSAQWSPYKLAVPEQVYLGGADTVRGFPLAVVLGDSGYYANLELRIPPPILANQRFFVAKKKWRDMVQLVAFLDHGGSFFYGGSNDFLWGSGIGFRLQGVFHLNLSLDVGFPLNHENFSTGAFTYIKITGQPF